MIPSLPLRARQLGRFLFLSLKVAWAFFAGEATPHPLCRLIETRIIELTGEIAHTSAFFAHDQGLPYSCHPFQTESFVLGKPSLLAF